MYFLPALTWLGPLVPTGNYLVTQGPDFSTFVGVWLRATDVLDAQQRSPSRGFDGFLDPEDESGGMKRYARVNDFPVSLPTSATVSRIDNGFSILTCSSRIFGHGYGYYVFSEEYSPRSRTPTGYKLGFWERRENRNRSYRDREVKVDIYAEEIMDPTDDRHRVIVMFCNILARRFLVLNRTNVITPH